MIKEGFRCLVHHLFHHRSKNRIRHTITQHNKDTRSQHIIVYHAMVLMAQMDISVQEVRDELASRHIIDHKVKQEKMV